MGRALEGRGDPEDRLADLARHFAECAALGEVDRAVDYGRRAAARATADLAFEEAAAHYERALGALDLADHPDDGVRSDLLLAQGEALMTGTDERYRPVLVSAADAARRAGDDHRLAAAAIRLSSGTIGIRPEAFDPTPEIGLLEEALSRLPDGDSGDRALGAGRPGHQLLHVVGSGHGGPPAVAERRCPGHGPATR